MNERVNLAQFCNNHVWTKMMYAKTVDKYAKTAKSLQLCAVGAISIAIDVCKD